MRDVVEPARRPELDRALSNAVARSYRRRTGRGPAKAQALHSDDLVVVVLRGTLTASERALVADSRQDAVRRFRVAIHHAMTAELAGVIRKLTGCRVLTALSADDVDRDIAAEVFFLEAPPSDQEATEPERIAGCARRPW
jgi:uncharacterized protein YbcI